MGTFTVHVINVKILPCARIVEKPLYTTLIVDRWSLIVDRLVTLIVVLRTLNMWELYIAVDCWIALNRVVTSKDTVLLICLNQRSGVKRIPQQYRMQRKIETFQVVPAENFRKEEVLYRFTRSKYFKCYGNLSVISFNFVNQLKALAAVFFS